MRNIRRNFRSLLPSGGLLQKWSTVVHHFINNNGFRSCETLNLYISSGIWGPTRHLPLKITNSLAILRLRKPLKTSTRLAGHGIWTRDLPNASLMLYHGVISLGWNYLVRFGSKLRKVYLNYTYVLPRGMSKRSLLDDFNILGGMYV